METLRQSLFTCSFIDLAYSRAITRQNERRKLEVCYCYYIIIIIINYYLGFCLALFCFSFFQDGFSA